MTFITFKENLNIFLNSKSIYFISIFLPIILTLIVAISVDIDTSTDYDLAYHYNSSSNDLVMESFLTKLDNNLDIYNYPTNEACLDSVRLMESSFCIILSDGFFVNNNQTDVFEINIGEKSLTLFDESFTHINSSLVSTLKENSLSDPITIKKIKIQDKSLLILITNILMFFTILLTIIFSSVVFFYRKSNLDDMYSNVGVYKKLAFETFFSSFVIFLSLSLVIFLLVLLAFGLSFSLIFKLLLILILSSSVFTFIGMFIGSLTKVEDINLFASISVASVMIFFSNLILRNYDPNSFLHYLFNLNPYHLITKLIKHTILFNNGFGGFVYELMILFVLLLSFATFFVALYYILIEKDFLAKFVIKDKSEKAYKDIKHIRKSVPSLSTEELSLSQFQEVEELRRKRKHYQSQSRTTYQNIVHVNVEKKKKLDQQLKDNTKDEKLVSKIDKKVNKQADKQVGNKADSEDSADESRGDEYLEELYKEQLKEEGK